MQPHYYDGRNANEVILTGFVGSLVLIVFMFIAGLLTMKSKQKGALIMGLLSLLVIFVCLVSTAIFQTSIITNPHHALQATHRVARTSSSHNGKNKMHPMNKMMHMPAMATHQMPRSQPTRM